ncbi:MAG: YncE family protein [Phycisphaerae bacterium]
MRGLGRRMAAVALMGAFGWTAAGWGANAPTYVVTKALKVGGSGGWDYVTLSDDGKKLFAPRSTFVQVIDTGTGKVLAQIPGTTKGHGVALAAGKGFATFGGDGTVVVFDATTYQVLGKIKTEADCDGIFYDAATQKVIVVSGDGNSVWRIDPSADSATAKAEGPLALGGAPESFAFDGQGKAFINLMNKNEIAVVDLNAWKVTDHWSVAPAKQPVGMAYDPRTQRLFSSCRSGQMVVLNATNGVVLSELGIGLGVDATVFDGQRAIASCGDGTMTVVGEKSPGEYRVLQTVKTAPGARTMVMDPHTHTIYLPTADLDPRTPDAVVNGKLARMRFVNGTFKIVVVSAGY